MLVAEPSRSIYQVFRDIGQVIQGKRALLVIISLSLLILLRAMGKCTYQVHVLSATDPGDFRSRAFLAFLLQESFLADSLSKSVSKHQQDKVTWKDVGHTWH